MAGVGVTTKNEVKYFYTVTAADLAKDTLNAAEVAALAVDANEIPCVMGVSDIGQTANTNEYSCHGEQSTRKIAGTPSIEDLELTVLADFTAAALNAIDALDLNTSIGVLVRLKLGAAETYFWVVGKYAGSRFVVNEDAPNQLVFTIAPDKIKRWNKA